jgi:uncharacterized coiled-coil DUF342 family protein
MIIDESEIPEELLEGEFPVEPDPVELPADKFRLVNRAPSFREMLEHGITEQIKEMEKLLSECNKQIKFLKKSKRELRGKTDEHLFKMLGDDHEAVKEYKRICDELNAYIDSMNSINPPSEEDNEDEFHNEY